MIRYVVLLALTLIVPESSAISQARGGRYVEPDPINFTDHTGWIRMFDGACGRTGSDGCLAAVSVRARGTVASW